MFGAKTKTAIGFSASIVAFIRAKFDFLNHVPYLFANASDPTTAKTILEQWDGRPESQHHRVAKHVMHKLRQDLEVVALGGRASRDLLAEEQVFRSFSLSEASIEGYHAEVAKVCARAHAGKAPYVFAEIRLRANLDRIRRRCCIGHGVVSRLPYSRNLPGRNVIVKNGRFIYG